MNFWIRNIIIGTILIGLASALLFNQDLLFSLNSTEESTPETLPVEETIEAAVDTSITVNKPKSKNAAAEGLSRFYANLHGSDNEDGPQIRNNVVYLSDPDGDIIELLEARRLVTRPLRKNWKSPVESRPFRKGQTLLQKLSEYAEDERLAVIWWLNRDLIIKDPFRIEKDISATTLQIANAVSGYFDHGVSAYFCYQQRTLVVIENEKNFGAFDYLNDECSLLKSKNPY